MNEIKEDMRYFWKKKDITVYILSLLILLIHTNSFFNYPDTGNSISAINNFFELFFISCITKFAVPMFFIISGALFFRNYDNSQYIRKIKTRTQSIVIPYLIWNTVWMLFAIVTSYTFISRFFTGREKFVLSLPNVLEGIFHYGCNLPFWFLFALIVFIAFSPLIDLIVKNKYVGMTAIVVLFILSIFDIGLPKPLFFSGYSIIYYLIGAVIGRHYFDRFTGRASVKKRVVSVFILILSAAYYYIYNINLIEINPHLNNLWSLACAYALWNTVDIFADRIKKHEFTKTSFLIFAMHLNIAAVITKSVLILLPANEYFAIPNFIITIAATLLIIHSFAAVLRKLSPKVYCLLSGNR